MTITLTKTRVALAILVAVLVVPATALADHVFDDVPDDAFYADPVEWAFTNNITTGKSPTSFAPLNNVTRGETVTFLQRYHDNIAEPADEALQQGIDANATAAAAAQAAADAAQADATANAGAAYATEALQQSIDANATAAAAAQAAADAAQADATANAGAAYATDPVPLVSFGPADTETTVGQLPLPAGSYIVSATLTANNNNDTEEEAVACSLLLGSTVIAATHLDSSHLVLGVNRQAGERESIALSGGGTLDAEGSADVVCQTSTASGNYIMLSITALRVGDFNGGIDASAGASIAPPPESSELSAD